MIPRHLTAIRRGRLSRPLRTALQDGLLPEGTSVLDYGCGHGEDVAALQRDGVAASGWDPVHHPAGSRSPSDLVHLGYVVNVIEDAEERAGVLRTAWGLAQQVLVVAARLTDELADLVATEYDDGHVTRLGTFQRFYAQQELRSWIEDVLSEPAVAAAPGVFYVFRDSARREGFLASRYRRRPSVPSQPVTNRLFAAHEAVFGELIAFLIERGRLPDVTETPAAAQLAAAVGSIRRAFGILRRVTGEAPWEQVRQERAQDLLVYLALGRFGRRPQWSALPHDLQLDIKAFFRTYRHACACADELLFSAGQPASIDAACATSSIGKVMPNALYVHVAGLHLLPPVLRVYVGCAHVLSGRVEGTTILKLHRHEPKVSYLAYPAFDAEAHPALASSLRVHLQTWDFRFRDFRDVANPPVLHRKELFVPPDYPAREEFARLTQEEDTLGLLGDPRIGTQDGWTTLLHRRGIYVSGSGLPVMERNPARRTRGRS